MNSDNDKTERQLFTEKRTVWIDENIYNNTYKKSVNIGQFSVEKALDRLFGMRSPKPSHFLRIDEKPIDIEEDDYYHFLGKILPELNAYKRFVYYMSFGYANIDKGRCDCCGKDINILNAAKAEYLCYDCDDNPNANQFNIGQQSIPLNFLELEEG